MKKFLSILLSFAMLLSACCVTASAENTGELDYSPYKNLYTLYQIVYNEHARVGNDRPTNSALLWQRLEETEEMFSDGIQHTDDEYQTAFDKLLEAAYNEDVHLGVIKTTYNKALEEQNYNNWYSESDWSEFVRRRNVLGALVEDADIYDLSLDPETTDAFYDMLYQYNLMTHRYQKTGDVNKDGVTDIKDVTLIQQYMAGSVEFTGGQKMLICYDALEYENININSATELQKSIVGLSSDIYSAFIEQYGYHEDYEWRLARTFNFFICPRRWGYYPLSSSFYDTEYLREFWLRYYDGPEIPIP